METERDSSGQPEVQRLTTGNLGYPLHNNQSLLNTDSRIEETKWNAGGGNYGGVMGE
jgi:hypothetical protein